MAERTQPFQLGKLPADHLARLLSELPIEDPRVVLGPRVGEDAAVLDMGDRFLIAKSDPVTFATDAIGWYAVHINANDVACTGAAPRWFLATLLLPGGRADGLMVDGIFRQIVEACEEVGAALVGGHTEITYGLDRPILVGAMLGEVEPGRLVMTGGARPSDAVLMTQRVAVEATAIIAREKREELAREHGLEVEFLERCADFIFRPGISVVQAARIATEVASVHAMHDPTEGGLATGLWELATAAEVGLEIDASTVPVFPETRLLCDLYGLDPWGIIASGSLLVTLDPAEVRPLLDAWARSGIEGAQIGWVTVREQGVTLRDAGGRLGAARASEDTTRPTQTVPLPTFGRDEIARLFE